MSFDVIAPRTPAAKPKVAADRVAISTRPLPGKGDKDRRMLSVQIGRGVAQALGWRKDAPLSVAWGTARDAGKLRIAPHDDGPSWVLRANKHKTVFTVTTSALPEDAPCEGAWQVVPHEVLPGASGRDPRPVLVLRLPPSVWRQPDRPAEIQSRAAP